MGSGEWGGGGGGGGTVVVLGVHHFEHLCRQTKNRLSRSNRRCVSTPAVGMMGT